MKIVIGGGSGHLGTMLARAFAADGDEVVVLSRSERVLPWRVVVWDGRSLGDWKREIDGSDVVINLAGRSVNCRYNARNRREIMKSRVASTVAIGEAIAKAQQPPHVWLQAGTATIYAHRFDEANDEEHGRFGGSELDTPDRWQFSIDVAMAWERALTDARLPRTRKVLMRTAMVMSPEAGGPFDALLGLVRLGLGGPAAGGQQFVSWIHYLDFIRAVSFLIRRPFLDGAVNLASLHPLPNAEFMRALREAWGARLGLPSSRWMLELGALIMGTETELVLKSRRVVPERLLRYGFRFEHGQWPDAARELTDEWRMHHGRAGMAAGAEPSW